MRQNLAIVAFLVLLGCLEAQAAVITFTDVSTASGIVEVRRGIRCAMVDFDLDRDLDLMVWNLLGLDDQLLDNDGMGIFIDVAESMGVLGSSQFQEERGSGFSDYNNDFYPDVYVTADIILSSDFNLFYVNMGGAHFSEMGLSLGIRSPVLSAAPVWGDVDQDGYLDFYVGGIPITGPDDRPYLYINNSGIGFSDQWQTRGFDFTGNGQAHLWWDWEDDGDSDLYIGGYLDASSDNMIDRIYRNAGSGSFSLASSAINSSPEKTVGVQLADFDADGVLDIFVLQEDTVNVLWRDNGDGTFTNIASALNLEMDPPTPGGNPELKTSAVVADFDNDMDPDIFVTWRDLTVGAWPSNQLWLNEGGIFVEVGNSAGFTEEANSPDCAAGDLNGDGFLDIYVVNNNQFGTRDTLYLNDGNSNHWFEIDPIGTISNRDAIGLKVWLTAGGVTQVQELYSTTTQPTRLHFGLASNEIVSEVQLRWPSGLEETYTDLPADQVFRPIEGDTSSVGQSVIWR